MPLAVTRSVSRATVSPTDRPLILVTVSSSLLVRVSGIAHLRMFASAQNDQDGQRDSQQDHRCGESNHDAFIQFYVFPTPYGPAAQCLAERPLPDEADADQCKRDTKDRIRPLSTACQRRNDLSHTEADGKRGEPSAQPRQVRPLAGEPRSSKPLTALVNSPRHPRIESGTVASLCQ